jgi:YggT family protein
MQSALIFLVKTLADLYLLTFLLRFIMQWVRASYYNPLAQFVLKVTSPLVVPARRLLPSVGGLDTPTLAVLVVLEIAVTFVLLRLSGVSLPLPVLLLYSLLRLIALALWFYTVALFIYVLLSWFGDRGINPMAALLGELVEPLLRPARRLLPPIGGLDLSPLIVILLLQAALIALPLPGYLR